MRDRRSVPTTSMPPIWPCWREMRVLLLAHYRRGFRLTMGRLACWALVKPAG